MSEPVANPQRLELRCYARQSGRTPGRWIAHCIDLDLWAVGPSMPAARASLENAIEGYLKTVLNTNDTGSIPRLLRRRAPWRFIALWHFFRGLSAIGGNGGWPLAPQPFREPFPPFRQLVQGALGA